MRHDTAAPISARFFPAARLGLLAGVVVAVVGAVGFRHTPPVVSAPVSSAGPLHGPEVVNVWLEGCSDCMPAFVAWQKLAAAGETSGMYVVNVAYGSADEAYARKYRVDEHLTFDPDGSKVVQPYGIGTFTTLVLDRDNHVLLRARPDAPDFAANLRSAWRIAVH